MIRGKKAILTGLVVAVATIGGLLWYLWHRPTRPQNLLLVTLDTCRADRLGCYGSKDVATPNLDEVARRGVLCMRAVTVSPLTLPAHATMLTGVFPTIHKVRNNMDFQLPKTVSTITEVLKRHGFTTGAVISGVPLAATFGLNRGFDFYDDTFTRVNLDMSHEREAGVVTPNNEKRAEEATTVAVAWLKANAGTKFFLWVHYFDPHADYMPPPPFNEQYKGRLYDGEVAYMDQCFGKLITSLKETRVLDRTAIIIVGDHGEGLGEHGEATHGHFLYQSVLRVPFIVSAPGLLPSGRVWEKQVRLVDIAPTALDILGIPCELPVQGRSLVGMFSGREPEEDLINYAENLFTFLTLGWAPLRAINEGRWKYIHAPTPELYDLDADAAELRNVATEHPQIVKEMREKLALMGRSEGITSPQPSALDPRVLDSIRSLGYVGGSGRIQAGDSLDVSGLKDPKEMLPIIHLINQGCTEANAGRPEAALRHFRQVLAQDPTNLMAWRLAAEACLRMKDMPAAKEACEQIVKLTPDAPSARYKLGTVLCEMGEFEASLEQFKKSLEIDPKFALGHAGIGAVRFRQGRLLEARREYETALELDPNLTLAAIGVAACLERAGAVNDAIKFLQSQTRRHPKNPVLHEVLGQTYRGAGQHEEAIACFKTAILLAPEVADGYLDLAGTYTDVGNYDAALTCLREALRIAPFSAEARHKMGKLYLFTERYADAETELRMALAADPNLAEAHNDLGVALQMQGQHDKAMEEYQKAVKLNATFGDAWQNMGLLNFSQGRYQEAVRCLRTAALLKRTDANAFHQLAAACFNAGELREAEAAVQAALRLNPNHPQAQALLKQLRSAQRK